MDIENLREYLTYLVTPQNEKEMELFRQEGLVDDYIKVSSRIPTMSFQELIDEINIQLKPYNTSINLLPLFD